MCIVFRNLFVALLVSLGLTLFNYDPWIFSLILSITLILLFIADTKEDLNVCSLLFIIILGIGIIVLLVLLIGSLDVIYCIDEFETKLAKLQEDLYYWQGDTQYWRDRYINSGLDQVKLEELDPNSAEYSFKLQCEQAIKEDRANVTSCIKDIAEHKAKYGK